MVGMKGDKGEFAGREQNGLGQRRAPIIRNPVFASQQPSMQGETSSSTFRGRFTQSSLYDHHHHHHHYGIVLGFIGPLFWPYAYEDFVDYTFSPYAYDTFWPYAFDDVYAGIYGGYAPEYDAPENAYAYAGVSGSESVYDRTTSQTTGSTAPSASAERICSGQASGLTDFPIQKIAQQVRADQKQLDLLDALKAASVKAVDVLQGACPSELPSTPTGRLAAMRTRVDAMLKAVQTVRPALDAFYQSLSDEQRERFIAVDADERAKGAQAANDLNDLCQGEIPTKSDLPTDRIERTLHLNADQDDRLRALDQATIDSAKMLQAKCQPDQTLTPTGRLAAMEDRLQVMSEALQTSEAALNNFYGSLSDEQKARFDRMKVRPS
ncbi:MAG: Spy/CpxP family protein refolding chaperone [Bradyrhizobium sp.]|nr:Spy/CpxP family protein refolding chaperone [Bradyrhizobium sp.]